jgi:hypothetical protein
MKLGLVILVICLVPVILMAYDLNAVAKRERERRLGLATLRQGRPVRSFHDADLEVYRRAQNSPEPPRRSKRHTTPPSRDLDKERVHWQKEKAKHDRELARVDASIRRLERRLAERTARRRPGERLRKDPTERVLQDSIESLREERKRLIYSFHERARKAGALPGWLRE